MHELIKKLSEMAVDEAEGACHYAKYAVKLKDGYPSVAKVLYDMSAEEMNHMSLLNTEAKKLLDKQMADGAENVAANEAIYGYLRECQIDESNKARMYRDQYKGM